MLLLSPEPTHNKQEPAIRGVQTLIHFIEEEGGLVSGYFSISVTPTSRRVGVGLPVECTWVSLVAWCTETISKRSNVLFVYIAVSTVFVPRACIFSSAKSAPAGARSSMIFRAPLHKVCGLVR